MHHTHELHLFDLKVHQGLNKTFLYFHFITSKVCQCEGLSSGTVDEVMKKEGGFVFFSSH